MTGFSDEEGQSQRRRKRRRDRDSFLFSAVPGCKIEGKKEEKEKPKRKRNLSRRSSPQQDSSLNSEESFATSVSKTRVLIVLA
jgi:hypothetical protein